MGRAPDRRRAPVFNAPPAWKRWLGAILLVAGGGACAAWGLHDTLAWLGSLHRGDGVVQTESAMLGLPFLGGSLCAIGPAFVVPEVLGLRFRKALEGVVRAMLGLMVAGILLLPLGAVAIDLVMAYQGYRSCDTQHRGRLTVSTWAGAGAACPAL